MQTLLNSTIRLRESTLHFCQKLIITVGIGLPMMGIAQEKAKMADQAVDIVGINTHLYYTGTIYDTRYTDIIKPRLQELGLRHLRDGNATQSAQFDTRVKELAGLGMKFLLICDTRFGLASSLTVSKDHIKSLNADVSKPVIMVEGPNEADNCGQFNPAGLITTTKDIWNIFKGDGATSGIPIAGPSFCNTAASPGIFASNFTDATNYMQYGNLHAYSGGYHVEGPIGGGWGISFDEAVRRYKLVSGNDPLILSETGYRASPDQEGHIGVTQRAASKYILRSMLYYLNKGITRNYLYQLIDNSETFGLLNTDGTPRQQFTALKNYISLLKDPGNSFTTGSLTYSLSGDQTNIHHTLLQKRDGRFYLIVWQGVNSANAGNTDVEPATRPLTLNLTTKISTAKVFTPTFNGTTVQATFNNPTSISLNVPDHILVIELTPAAPDLVVSDVNWSPVSPATGNAITFSAVIKNQGTAATPAGIIHGVSFSVNGTVVSWSDNSTASLAAGASRTVTANSGPSGVSSWTAGANGNYTVVAYVDDVNRMTESNKANNIRSETLIIGSNTAVARVALEDAQEQNPSLLTLYPNPVGQVLTIASATDLSSADISLRDGTGRVLKCWEIHRSPQEISLQLSEAKSGVYLLKVATGQGVITRKVVIVR